MCIFVHYNSYIEENLYKSQIFVDYVNTMHFQAFLVIK